MKRNAMKKILIGLVAAGGLGLIGSPATDAATDSRIDQRQRNQEHRIQQGLSSGRLTRDEYRVLTREQRQIARMESRAMVDGRLSYRERAEIERAQDQANQNIRRLLHDDDRFSFRR